MIQTHVITKKASNFTDLSAKYKLYLIFSRRIFEIVHDCCSLQTAELSPLRYTDVV